MTTNPSVANQMVAAETTALDTPTTADLPARTLIKVMLGIACFLIPVSFVTNLAALTLPDFFARDLLASLFDLGGEANLPAAFSAVILWIAAGLLWTISLAQQRQRDRYARAWRGLSIVFAYLGLDEFAQLHDRTVPFLRTVLGDHASGGMNFAWILVFGPLALIVFLATIPFLRSLRARTSIGMMVSGAVYLAGALGLEVVKGVVDERYGVHSVQLLVLINVAEALEILGVILFIATLLAYWREELPGYRVLFGLKEHRPVA